MKKIENIKYAGNGCELDVFLPDCEKFPVFVFFHGGGLAAGDKSEANAFWEYLVSRGVAVVSANYRTYPDAVYDEFLRDGAAAVAWVKNNINNYGQCIEIYVGGSSAGGYISMMLCFDKKFLGVHDINPREMAGFVHDSGQPTVHYNILRERGLDQRRIIVDESAPIYHVGMDDFYPPMLFLVSDKDMENRYEQTMLMISTLKHFGHDMNTVSLKVMSGTHCAHVWKKDDNNDTLYGKIIYEFIKNSKRRNLK